VTIEHAFARFDSLVVKPVDGGSSMGVTRCLGVSEALLAAGDVLRRDGVVLVEEFIAGIELTVAIADVDGETLACPAIDVSTTMKSDIPPLSMRAGTTVWSPVGDGVPHVLDTALSVHNALGLRHFSRIDLIVDGDGRAVVLEANSIPGMSAAGLWRRSLNAGGVAAQSVLSDLAQQTVDSTSAST
jgi:D-alanine-D-alanine ligase